MTEVHDIIGAKEKQAAAKQTFVFHAPLANESPAKQERSVVARIRELISRKEIKIEKEKQAAAEQTFVFHAPLANELPAKQERSARARIRELISRKEIKVEKGKEK